MCTVGKRNAAELMTTMSTFSDYAGEPPSYQAGLIIASKFLSLNLAYCQCLTDGNESCPEAPLLDSRLARAAVPGSNAFRIHTRDHHQLNQDMCKVVHAGDRNQLPTHKMRESQQGRRAPGKDSVLNQSTASSQSRKQILNQILLKHERKSVLYYIKPIRPELKHGIRAHS